jgi:glucokinase
MGILAIDFGGTRTRAAWFSIHPNAGFELKGRRETLSLVQQPAEVVIRRIIDTAREVAAAADEPIHAIGISAPGPLDACAGVIHHAESLLGWREIPLAKIVGEAFSNTPTYLENDANLAALAEYHLGAARGADPAIYLTISTGIGGGAVIGGRLFTGWRRLAIEPGHMRFLLPDGKLYRLEELASGTALGFWMRHKLANGVQPSILRSAAVVDGRAVGEAARQGDPLALEVVREAGFWLGLGLVNLLHLFNPQAIVVGGSAARLGDLLFEPARRVIQANILDPAFYAPDLIRPAQLGDDVCLFGAAYYAQECRSCTARSDEL